MGKVAELHQEMQKQERNLALNGYRLLYDLSEGGWILTDIEFAKDVILIHKLNINKNVVKIDDKFFSTLAEKEIEIGELYLPHPPEYYNLIVLNKNHTILLGSELNSIKRMVSVLHDRADVLDRSVARLSRYFIVQAENIGGLCKSVSELYNAQGALEIQFAGKDKRIGFVKLVRLCEILYKVRTKVLKGTELMMPEQTLYDIGQLFEYKWENMEDYIWLSSNYAEKLFFAEMKARGEPVGDESLVSLKQMWREVYEVKLHQNQDKYFTLEGYLYNVAKDLRGWYIIKSRAKEEGWKAGVDLQEESGYEWELQKLKQKSGGLNVSDYVSPYPTLGWLVEAQTGSGKTAFSTASIIGSNPIYNAEIQLFENIRNSVIEQKMTKVPHYYFVNIFKVGSYLKNNG